MTAHLRTRELLWIALVLPFVLGAHEKDWRKVAESHVRFARRLAAAGTPFDAALRARLVADRIRGDCVPRPSRIRDLTVSDRATLKSYLLEVCVPQFSAWSEVLGECTDRIVTPRWCDSEDDQIVADHVGLQAYFDALAQALGPAPPEERGSIMGVLAGFLDAGVLRHYPQPMLDRSVAAVVAEFLRHATAEEGFRVAETVLDSSFGTGYRTREAFREFRRGDKAFSTVQQCAFDAMLKLEDPTACPGYVPQVPTKSEEQIEEARRAVQRRATSPESLERLRQRVDAFYALQRAGDWSGSYEFMTLDRREGGYDRESWVRTNHHVHKNYPLVAWRIAPRVLVFDNAAEVLVTTSCRSLRGENKGQVDTREREEYWYFENDTWSYGFSIEPEEWDPERATEVTLVEAKP